MGKEEIEALIRILEAENTRGLSSLVLGTWSIKYDKTVKAFSFDKCENDGIVKSVLALLVNRERSSTKVDHSLTNFLVW